jgi:hypothetical protein
MLGAERTEFKPKIMKAGPRGGWIVFAAFVLLSLGSVAQKQKETD